MCLGIPARIVAVDAPETQQAIAELDGVRREVCTMLLEDGAAVGDWVIVHVGFALCKLDEDEAAMTLSLLREAATAVGR